MATYAEIYGLQNTDTLLNKVVVAIVVAAETIRTETPGTTNHAKRMVWAERAFADPRGLAPQVLWAVLAANKGSTVEQITTAEDATVQANVDAVVNVLAGE